MSSIISGEELNFLITTMGKNKTIVEIGCYKGGTTCALAEFNKVIAIDPFLSNYDHEPGYNTDPILNMEGIEEVFSAAIKGKNVIWHKEKSEDVLKWWEDEIDGVFIDGNHSESYVLIDIGWVSFIRKEGIIAFHDYITRQGVRNVVDKYIKSKHKEIGIIENLIIFRKTGGSN